MDERDAEAVLLLAESLLGVGKAAEAAALLRGLEGSRPGDARVRRLLVEALLRQGDYAAAEPPARALAETATGGNLPPALFFHAYSLWGCGNVEACRTTVARYAASLGNAGKTAASKERNS